MGGTKRAIPFAKITIPLILGIILNAFVNIPFVITFYNLLLSFICYLLFFFLWKNSLTKRIILSTSFYVFILFTGVLISQQQYTKTQNNSITRSNYIKGKVTDIKKITDSIISFEFKITEHGCKHNWQKQNNGETVLVRLKKKEISFYIKPHHNYLLKGYIKKVSPPKTPQELNFKSIYAKKNIYYFFYTDQSATKILPSKQSFLNKYKTEFIRFLQINFDRNTSAFLSALIANEKEYIPKKLKEKITKNGISHLIAISGLHIGIIYLLLNFFANLIPKSRKAYRTIASVLICAALVMYGTFCGFTPSIARSVTMFCVMQFAQIISRKNNSINSLFVAAFLILIIQPSELFQVGFQLSFAGVFGILLFYSQINSWVDNKTYILEKLWNSIAVTFSAQVGVLPTLLFYFKTFSINGIFLSLVLTILTTLLVGFSIVLLLLFKVPLINEFLIITLQKLAFVFFWLLNMSSLYPISLIYKNMTILTVILCYLIIIILFKYLKYRNAILIKAIIISFICFYLIQQIQKIIQPNSLYIYNKEQLTLQYDTYTGNPYGNRNQFPFTRSDYRGNKLVIINKKLILFQKNSLLTTYQNIDILFLSKEIAQKKLQKIHPKIVIFDKNLSRNYIKNTISALKKSKISFHSLEYNGFFSCCFTSMYYKNTNN